MRASAHSTHPRALAVIYTPFVPILQLCECAHGRWSLIWIVDRSIPGTAEDIGSLRRLGSIADITDLDAEQMVDTVATFCPTGVISFGEETLVLAALIADRLGLPGNSAATVRRLHNKASQREALAAHGVCTPAFRRVSVEHSIAHIESGVNRLTFPVVIKPQEGSGSRETHRARDAHELLSLIENIRRATGSDQLELIVEEYLPDSWPRSDRPDADYVSVESVISAGRIGHITVTGKTALAEPFLETGDFVPSNLSCDATAGIFTTTEHALRALEAATGVYHTEIKLTPQGPRVIEVNGRVAGPPIPEMLSLAGGPSLFDLASQAALGLPVECHPTTCARVGFTFIASPPLGATRLARMENLHLVSRLPGVAVIEALRRPGDTVSWRDGFEARVLSVYGAVDDHEEMWRVRDEIARLVRLEFE